MSSRSRRERAMQESEAVAVMDSPSDTGQDADQAVQATQESLDKVRDILFGSQLRQQDHRFEQLEEKIAGQFASLSEETRRQVESIQEFAKAELASLSNRLAAESQQRVETIQRLADELRGADRGLAEKLDQAGRALADESKAALGNAANEWNQARNALESRLNAGEQQFASSSSELRAQLLEQTGKLREENKQYQAELQGIVEKLVSDLRSAKTDRSTLATLFTEMAGRLQG